MKLLLSVVVLLLGAARAGAADFAVDVAVALKPVDHAASGALYGIAAPGWPPQQFIDAIHPKNFTEMATGGRQLPNGETAPVGDALIVAPVAAQAGASVTMRLPDIFPDFPYIWRGPAFWTSEIQRIVKATVAAKPPNIYAYEIWNEPDWNWQVQWGGFDAMWASTASLIRAADPSRRIMGPSASQWNADWMRRFLISAKASGTVPDIVSWHELDPGQDNDIEAHVAAYRALEKTLGLDPRPISINEYGSPRAMADPGALTHYIAQLERSGVDTADLAFWHRPGRLSDLLVPRTMGTGPAVDPEPTGAYWLYAWYGAMRGSMVSAGAAPGSGLDGFAAYDATRRRVAVIIGGAAGAHTVTVSGLQDLGLAATVNATATHRTGTDGAAPQADELYDGTFPIAAGKVVIPVALASASDAVDIEITPSADSPSGGGPLINVLPHPVTQRIEAETGSIAGGRKFTIRQDGNFAANAASGNAYAGLFNKAGASLTLPVRVPTEGIYELGISYSNGQPLAEVINLAVNHGPAQALALAPTQGRELFGLAHARVTLPAGTSSLVLSLAVRSPGPPSGPSAVEFDYVDITAP